MSQCSLIPKTFTQIPSVQSLSPSPSNVSKCTNSSSADSPSTYTGSGYRSVAFGTWAVGDASRCFEGRKRGKSATALASGRTGRLKLKEDECGRRMKERREDECGRREEKEDEGGRRMKGRRKEEEDECGRRNNKKEWKRLGRKGQSDSAPSHSLRPPPPPSPPKNIDNSDNSSPLSRSLCDIPRRRSMDSAALRELDLYSSSEYVRHSNGTGREVGTGICYENVAVHPAALTCSSPSSVYHHRNNGGCSLETLFLPPGRCPAPLSPCPSRTSCPPVQQPLRRLLHQHKQWPAASFCKSPQQFSFIIDPLAAKEMPRMRTKSLDNGLKVSLGAAIRRRKDRICEGAPMGGPAGDGTGSRKSAFCERELSPAGAESPLGTAKNFLRRFYNQSTLRLTGRRRRRGNGAKKGDDQKTEQSLYSSAMGPFFEMRKPQPEEMPFLPYNIHYTIESTDEASDGSAEEDNAVPRPLRPGSPQSEWSCTPTCSSATITTSPNAVTNSLITSPSTTANFPQRPTAVDGLFEAYPHQQQHHHRSVLASKDVPMAPSSPTSPSSPQHFPQQSESLLAETVATTPSVGYGSLKSSSDSEGRRDSDKTRRMGPAEKRFADWNDLFQYLRREIMEMNVRDAQILRRLEGIQLELNGVRQMSGQQRR